MLKAMLVWIRNLRAKQASYYGFSIDWHSAGRCLNLGAVIGRLSFYQF